MGGHKQESMLPDSAEKIGWETTETSGQSRSSNAEAVEAKQSVSEEAAMY